MLKKISLSWLLGLLLAGLSAEALALEACTAQQTAEALAPATAATPALRLRCNLSLQAGDVVSKRLIVEGREASGLHIDCHGARLDGGPGSLNAGRDMIEVRSRRRVGATGPAWERPEDVRIENCRVEGSIRVWGMGVNGQGADLVDASRQPGYVEQVRANGPRRIEFRRLRLVASGRIPFYLGPGVSEVTLADSEITGLSNATAIYLDAESTANTIEGNRLSVTARREAIAIDASSHNLIRNNRFEGQAGGGIYLYRNCGEGGTIRHTTPSHNRIVANTFVYAPNQDKAAVFLGSRDGNRWYCWADIGHDFGSSADNRDFARHNVVRDNRFVGREPGEAIITGAAVNAPNDIGDNKRVTAAGAGG